MRIAQVAPLHIAVPPLNYGGTERCIYNLTEGLVRLGHQVTLFATGDSRTSAHLEPVLPSGIDFDPKVDAVALQIAELAEVYRRADEFDVIHSHLDYLALPYSEASRTPTVHTLHGRLDRPDFLRVFSTYAQENYVAISASQRAYLPHLNWVGIIHHAVDVARFDYSPTGGDYLAFVGRMAPEKGPERAIEIAKRAGIPLKIAAKVDSTERAYFESVVEPLLDHPLIEWLGPLAEREKIQLLSGARALLLPITWPEPFGLVYIESLACGTPVLTCPSGSASEILCDGVTGFLRETDDELVAAISHVDDISREGCRDYVRKKFDIKDMALKYVNVYSKVQQRRPPFAIQAEVAGEPVAAPTTRSANKADYPVRPHAEKPATSHSFAADAPKKTASGSADERVIYP